VANTKWLSEDEQRAWRGYLHMRTLLTAQIGRDLADDSGLSDPDYTVLSNLSEAEGHRWRLNELAARMLWSKSRLSHHIDRMQERGLVAREDCVTDGRGAFVVLTTNGLRAIRAAAPSHVASVRRHFIDLLTPAEIDTLATIAGKVVDHLGEPATAIRRTAPA
jgi:DNA-binding MarR family transcriptional regulator